MEARNAGHPGPQRLQQPLPTSSTMPSDSISPSGLQYL
jgi:hypothetical protein